MKRKNPYTRLLDEIRSYCRKVKYRHTKNMWLYPKNRLEEGWDLKALFERTKAADQLGYEVVLKADDDGLRVNYTKCVPDIPYEWR